MGFITINDEIDDYTVFEVDATLQNADLEDNFDVIISSGGGSITAGLQIVAKLDSIKGKKTAHIQGLAASMATVIASACDEITMSENGFFMIHNPWTVAMGESEDLRKQADIMDKMRNEIINIYGRKTNLSNDELIAMMDAETWLTPKEALKAGFIDSISKNEMSMAASIFRNGLQFKNLPKELETKLKGVSAMADFEETEELVEEVEEVETSEEVLEEEEVEIVNTLEDNVEELEEIEEENTVELEDDQEVIETVEEESKGLLNGLMKLFGEGKTEQPKEFDYTNAIKELEIANKNILEENDQLAELANGLQVQVEDLQGKLEDHEESSNDIAMEMSLVMDAVIDGKVTAHQLKQLKDGELNTEQFATLIQNNDLGILPQVEQEEVIAPVLSTEVPHEKFNSPKELGEWLNLFEGVRRSQAFSAYNKKFK